MNGKEKKYYLFSNGTEFMLWTARNCERCVKYVHYNEKTDTMPKYRCAIQKHIEMALIGDGTGNKRDYEATHQCNCPHIITNRKVYQRRLRKDKSQLELEF